MNIQNMIDDFERDGFVLCESLLPPATLAAAQEGVKWAIENRATTYKWIAQYTYEWFREAPAFVEIIEHPLVLEFAEARLGPDFHLIAAQCSRNTQADPYAPGAMLFHQDRVFLPNNGLDDDGETHGFSAMWYMQDTPLEMGPTALITGSQYSDRDYTAQPPQDSEVFSKSIPAGSLLMFNHRTWHSGRHNDTAVPRDLITNAYARRTIEKVQLTKPADDGTQRYVPCEELLADGSAALRQLLTT